MVQVITIIASPVGFNFNPLECVYQYVSHEMTRLDNEVSLLVGVIEHELNIITIFFLNDKKTDKVF